MGTTSTMGRAATASQPGMGGPNRRDAARAASPQEDTRPGAGRRSVGARHVGIPPTASRPAFAPAKAELVERFDTGERYLRAYIDGHFYWQPVTGPIDAIRDSSVWMSDHTFHEAYWYNQGTYRRRSGSYYPVEHPAADRQGGDQ